MPKVQVTKEHYEYFRNAEKITGKKVKDLVIGVPDCVEGIHGVYQVKCCYKTNHLVLW
ncbi:hypothetical protein ACFSCX_20205 [Bacillus salitolerans]|uniref:Uncharacterized protein n=1 Tax=Bacillus salitolerans TaxID=1437434 RepID=A0ABW4LUL0_9BACI